jgi:hypothetical protein
LRKHRDTRKNIRNFEADQRKTSKEAAILILEAVFHSFTRNAFSYLDKYIHQVAMNSARLNSYQLTIRILKDCLTKETQNSNMYFVVDEIAERDSDNKDLHRIINELQNNYMHVVITAEHFLENLMLRSSPDRRSLRNEN